MERALARITLAGACSDFRGSRVRIGVHESEIVGCACRSVSSTLSEARLPSPRRARVGHV